MSAGVATAMLSYNTPSDVPAVISRAWTRRWLRDEAAFDGLVVTDWLEVYNQLDWHRTAATRLEAVVQALLRSSMDMARPRSPAAVTGPSPELPLMCARCSARPWTWRARLRRDRRRPRSRRWE